MVCCPLPHATPRSLLYKLHGEDAELQMGPLPPEERAHLDATPLEELLAFFRAQKGGQKSCGANLRAQKPAVLSGSATSGYRGVCWDKRGKKWRVRIKDSGADRHVGQFELEIDAARAYDRVARKLHGSCVLAPQLLV